MTTISKELACEIRSLGVRIDTQYSGRFMFGRRCFGIIVDDVEALIELALDLPGNEQEEFRQVLRTMRSDNMGFSKIVYFPAYQWPEDVE